MRNSLKNLICQEIRNKNNLKIIGIGQNVFSVQRATFYNNIGKRE